MVNLTVNGSNVRITKYKLIIYEESDKPITTTDAALIAQYLWEEGFIKKDDFPVEIVSVED